MENKQRKALKYALENIPSLIGVYAEDESQIDITDSFFTIYSLLELLDKFVSQPEAREVLNLLTDAKNIAEDEAESLDSKETLNERYGDLYKRVEALEAKLSYINR